MAGRNSISVVGATSGDRTSVMLDANPPPPPRATSSMESGGTWYEFMNADLSAIPLAQGDAFITALKTSKTAEQLEDDDKDRMVMKPGTVDDWVPMKEALQRAASSQESILELSDHEDSVDVSAGEAPSSASSAQDRTSVVTSVTHGISVKHDPKTGGLAGLPAAWTTLLPDGAAPQSVPDSSLPPELRPKGAPKPGERLHTDGPLIGQPFNVSKWRPQFGLPLEAVEMAKVDGFDVPILLIKLYGALKENGGLDEEGIFRLAPDALKCDEMRKGLNTDAEALSRIEEEKDTHVLANLIKIVRAKQQHARTHAWPPLCLSFSAARPARISLPLSLLLSLSLTLRFIPSLSLFSLCSGSACCPRGSSPELKPRRSATAKQARTAWRSCTRSRTQTRASSSGCWR